MATIMCATLPPVPPFVPFEVKPLFNPSLVFHHSLLRGALA